MAAEPDVDPDPELLNSVELARAALAEITPAANIGEPAGYRAEPGGVITLLFTTTQPGYPGWFWNVSLARVADAEPTVLEVELLPGDDALLAPDWVPWAVRLAEYKEQQAQLAAASDADELDEADHDADLDDDLDDDDDLDEDADDDDEDDDFDADESLLHAGDVDGVDIDEDDLDTDDLDGGDDLEGDDDLEGEDDTDDHLDDIDDADDADDQDDDADAATSADEGRD
ncbi:MAG: DUF3027 domain-containing protein [Microbacterium ginsengisoli]|nr:DUF3027 domain-containing protein [Microbacterium ginsengisoli]MBN9209605.1 DUF3027 domain-containing protein [Microbacterium ginsengisoli]